MGLTATLTARLDCRSIGNALLGQLAGPAANLGTIAVPLPPGGADGAVTAAGSVDASPLQGAVAQIAGRIPQALAALPQADQIVGPITGLLDLAEQLAANDLPGLFDSTLVRLKAEIGGAASAGHVAVLLRVAELLRDAPEGRALTGLVGAFVPPQFSAGSVVPLLDILRGLDGAVRILGGLMCLETVLAEGERLAALLASRLNPAAIDDAGARLRAALGEGSGALAARLDALDVNDGAALARLVAEVIAVAAALGNLRERFALGLAMDEATLAYLDIDALQAEIDAARAMIRGADADPAVRVTAALARLIEPLLGFDLGAAPAAGIDTLLAQAEARVAGVAQSIDALDLSVVTRPLADGLAALTAPLREITRVLEAIMTALRGALDQVRAAVAALPLDDLADSLRSFLAPIADALDAVRELLEQIEAALDAAAAASSAALTQVDTALDTFQGSIDGFFGEARAAVEQVDLGSAAAAVAENIQRFADVLAQAQMKPYFDTAVSAIGAATDVVEAVPFDLLPESMKADVDAAVLPIKQVDVDAVEQQIETLLGIGADGRFALRDELEDAVEQIHLKFQALIAVVDEHHPRTLLAEVNTQLDQLARQVREIEPDLTLQPVRDALDAVQQAVEGIDLDALLQPVRDAFAQITTALDGLSVAALVAPVQQRIAQTRTELTQAIRLDRWEPALDELRVQVLALLERADPQQLRGPIEGALAEAQRAIAQFPALKPGAALGTVVAGMLVGTGRRIQPASFPAVLDWLGGSPAAAALGVRSEHLALSLDHAAGLLDRVDPAQQAAALNDRFAALAAAVLRLRVRVGAGDASTVATLDALGPALDSAAVFGELAAHRNRYRAALQHSIGRAGAFRRSGFSEADVGLAALGRMLAPLAPAGAKVQLLFGAIGISPAELSVNGVLTKLLAAAPPQRLVGIVMPVFEAVHRRLATLLDAVLDPLRAAVAELRALLDAIDLAPLVAGADAIVAQARAEIESLSPDHVLAEPLQSFLALRAAIVDADPLAAVAEILRQLRELIAQVLEKLDLERLLREPIAIYDHILGEVRSIDPRGLLTPVFDQLDQIAQQVDTGLDDTVASFKRLQDALPSGGGGSSGSVSGSISL
jgi:cell division septum initiation protein DivIVA